MPYSRRRRWVQKVTGETHLMPAARALGVPRQTLTTWLHSGMPIGRLVPYLFQFDCDPVEAMVVWGYIPEDQVDMLNWAAIVQYAPMEILAEELRRRAAHPKFVDVGRKSAVAAVRPVQTG